MSEFQLTGLEHGQFAGLFDLSDTELAARGAVRCIAESDKGFPCRVSLEDAAAGDELLLLHYVHHPVESPYRESGPIFVRRGQTRRVLPPGVLPDYVTRRVMSVRAYDKHHMMIDAHLSEGSVLAPVLDRLFDDPAVDYVHLHNAIRGCFSCQVRRV